MLCSNKSGEIAPAFTYTSPLCISDLILNYAKPMCLIMLLGALTGVRVICCSICPKVGAAVNTATWHSERRARPSQPVPRAAVAGGTNQPEDDPNAQHLNAIQLKMLPLANGKKRHKIISHRWKKKSASYVCRLFNYKRARKADMPWH